MSAHRGEVVCKVTTAKALDVNQMKELQTSLSAFLNKGDILKLTTKVCLLYYPIFGTVPVITKLW